jgi:hypothetical protein
VSFHGSRPLSAALKTCITRFLFGAELTAVSNFNIGSRLARVIGRRNVRQGPFRRGSRTHLPTDLHGLVCPRWVPRRKRVRSGPDGGRLLPRASSNR